MNNSLGPEGARHIAGVLRSGNKRLKKINLYWNNIGNQGLEAICGGLASNYPRDFVLVSGRYPNLASFQDFPANISKTKIADAATNTPWPPCQSVWIAQPLPPHFLFPPLLKSIYVSHALPWFPLSHQDVRYNGFDRSDPSVNWELMEEQLKKSKLEYEGEPEKCRFRGWPQD